MPSVFELHEKFMWLRRYIDDETIDENEAKNAVKLFVAEREEKAEAILMLMANTEAELAAVKEWQERFRSKRQSIENQLERLKMLLGWLVPEGAKIKTALGSAYWQCDKAVEVLDESQVPAEYRVPQPDKIDKRKALSDLKEGLAIDGLELRESLGLRVRKIGKFETAE